MRNQKLLTFHLETCLAAPASVHDGARGGLRWMFNALALAGVLVGALQSSAIGQTTTGSIFGSVQDQSGNFIPNAQGTSTDVHTGITRTVQTNESGNYIFLPCRRATTSSRCR